MPPGSRMPGGTGLLRTSGRSREALQRSFDSCDSTGNPGHRRSGVLGQLVCQNPVVTCSGRPSPRQPPSVWMLGKPMLRAGAQHFYRVGLR